MIGGSVVEGWMDWGINGGAGVAVAAVAEEEGISFESDILFGYSLSDELRGRKSVRPRIWLSDKK